VSPRHRRTSADAPVADSLVHQLGSDGRVDTATDGTNDLTLGADKRADTLNLLVDEGFLRAKACLAKTRKRQRRRSHHGPPLLATADVDDKAAEDVLAAERVGDFGVELDAVDGLVVVGNGGERGGFRRRDGGKVVWERVQSVRVRHPDRRLVRDAFKELVEVSRSTGGLTEDLDDGLAVFPVVRSLDARAKVVGGFLHRHSRSAPSTLPSRKAARTWRP
jgi:hypothetical protein